MKNYKKIEAVIFDLSGTLVDFGSLATIEAMKKIFKNKGVIIDNNTIKKDMGIKKIKHLKKILNYPIVKAKWKNIFGIKISTTQINELNKNFDNELKAEVKKKLNIIPNVKNLFKILKKNNIKIGATTGYPKKITKIIIDYLHKNKVYIDYYVSDDEVKNSRPSPDMCIKNIKKLKVSAKNSMKVDDSVAGIVEGNRAGMISVALTLTGINLGKNLKTFRILSNKNKNKIILSSKKIFKKVNAKYIINDHFEFEKLLKEQFKIF